MAEMYERVATLEGRVQEQTTRMADFRDGISGVQQSVVDLRGDMGRMRDDLRGEIATTRDALRGELAATRDELRGEIVALRDEVHGEIAALRDEVHGEIAALRDEVRGEIAALRGEMDRRFDRVDQKFTWLVGIAVATGLATIGTIGGAFFGLLQAIQQHA
jgi:hypothetical protein